MCVCEKNYGWNEIGLRHKPRRSGGGKRVLSIINCQFYQLTKNNDVFVEKTLSLFLINSNFDKVKFLSN